MAYSKAVGKLRRERSEDVFAVTLDAVRGDKETVAKRVKFYKSADDKD